MRATTAPLPETEDSAARTPPSCPRPPLFGSVATCDSLSPSSSASSSTASRSHSAVCSLRSSSVRSARCRFSASAVPGLLGPGVDQVGNAVADRASDQERRSWIRLDVFGEIFAGTRALLIKLLPCGARLLPRLPRQILRRTSRCFCCRAPLLVICDMHTALHPCLMQRQRTLHSRRSHLSPLIRAGSM